MEKLIPTRLTTLGHPQRLAIFRLLVRRYPDAVPAGELAEALTLKASTMSNYLSALLQCGLIVQHRVGTSLRYTVDMSEVQTTLGYLIYDCCRGRPDLCSPLSSPKFGKDRAMSDPKYSVLFICTGNSARSIFAEKILNDTAGARFQAFSAGTTPKSELNPFALQILQQNGHDVSDLRAKHVGEFQTPDAPDFDFVFTVCDRAANEECPPWPGQPVSAHWGIPDPVKADGSQSEKSLEFQKAYGALRNRITAFTSLPIGSLDSISLQRAVDEIGRDQAEVPA